MLGRAVTRIAYAAIACGLRFPQSKRISDFRQWGVLIDIIERLHVNVFLDVGANRGFFSKHLRMAGYEGRIASFEPNPDDHEAISVISKHDKNWRQYNFGLGARSETKQFHTNHCNGETTLSSFLSLRDEIGQSKTVLVQVHRLDEVLPEIISGIDSPRVFLKMDTQGYDDKVLEGAGDLLNCIVAIQSEISIVPLYDDMPHYTESLTKYEQLGFSIVDMFPVNKTPDGRVIEYDCLMTNTTGRR